MTDLSGSVSMPPSSGEYRSAMALSFSEATEVTLRSGGAVHDTSIWSARMAEGWDILGNANGGYMLAIAARAMAEQLERPDPISVTGHFLAPGRVGPLDVEVTTIRSGRQFATARAEVRSEDGPVLSTIGTFGDLTDPGRVVQFEGAPPELPPLQDCPTSSDSQEFQPEFMHRVALRLHPDDTGFDRGEPSGEARVRGWFEFPDAAPVDTIALMCVLDAFPPTAFNTSLPRGWVPTLELTAHVRARPAPGPLACEFTSRFVTDRFMEEDGLVWDSTGRLVGQSRQLALVPRAG